MDTKKSPETIRKKLGDIVSFVLPQRQPASAKDGVPYITVDVLEQGSEDVSAKNQKLADVHPSDIILIKDGYHSGAVFRGLEGRLGSTLISLRINDHHLIHYDFLLYYLTYLSFKMKGFQRGDTIRHLNPFLLKSQMIPIPSMQEQLYICQELKDIECLVSEIRKRVYKISQILKPVNLKDKSSISKMNKTIMSFANSAWLGQLSKVFKRYEDQ